MEGIEVYAPYFSVTAGGKQVPRENITSLEIDEDLEGPGMCMVSLAGTTTGPGKSATCGGTPRFQWLEDESLFPGSKVEIRFGYTGPKGQKGLFVGRVKALSPQFQSSGTPSLTIQGYDPTHSLQDTYGAPAYTKVTYSQIVQELSKDLGLDTGGIESPKSRMAGKKHEKVSRKKNESDYAFIKRLAEEIGNEFFVSAGKLYFREPLDTTKGEVTFTFGTNIIRFSPRLSAAMTVNEVIVTGWDEKSKKPIREKATIDDVKNTIGIANFDRLIEKAHGKKGTVKVEGKGIDSADEAKEMAVRELKRRNKGFITGSLECIGDSQLQPGMAIVLKNCGSPFSGDYYIMKTKHSMGDGGYKTTLEVRRCV